MLPGYGSVVSESAKGSNWTTTRRCWFWGSRPPATRPRPPWSSGRATAAAGSCAISCARRSTSTPASAGWCRRSQRAPHVDVLDGIVVEAMKEANVGFAQLSAVAAAAGPGLIGGVIVGLTTAKAHRDGARHAADRGQPSRGPRADAAARPARLPFPICLFLASGGHTQIVAVVGVGDYVRLGTTVDDAMGEAFDKVAKMLSLPYPGGPEVERQAARGDRQTVRLSAADARAPRCQFLAVGTEDRGSQRGRAGSPPLEPQDVADLCAGFQAAVLESTADRPRRPAVVPRTFGPPRALVAAGGVAANRAIGGALRRRRGQSGDHADHPAAGALHRQWRDDRLGRRRADGARALSTRWTQPPRARWPLDANATAPAGFVNTRAGFRDAVH